MTSLQIVFLNILLIFTASCSNDISSTSAEKVVNTDDPMPQLLIQYNNNQQPLFYIEYEYDDEGKLIKEIQTDSTQNPVLVREKIYTYEDTLLTQTKVLANSVFEYEINYYYNDKNQTIKEETKSSEVENIVTFTYDDRGNAIEQVNTTTGGGSTRMEFQYNENDRIIDGKSYNVANQLVKWNKNVYVNDTLTDLLFLSAAGDTTHHIIYEYQNGLLMMEKELGKDGNVYVLKEYTYDNSGKLLGEKASKYQNYRILYIRDEAGEIESVKSYDQYEQLMRVVYYK